MDFIEYLRKREALLDRADVQVDEGNLVGVEEGLDLDGLGGLREGGGDLFGRQDDVPAIRVFDALTMSDVAISLPATLLTSL